jgi:hypothetical protein
MSLQRPTAYQRFRLAAVRHYSKNGILRKIERIATDAAMVRAAENIIKLRDFNVLRHYLGMEHG